MTTDIRDCPPGTVPDVWIHPNHGDDVAVECNGEYVYVRDRDLVSTIHYVREECKRLAEWRAAKAGVL